MKKLDAQLLQDLSLAVDDLFQEYEEKAPEPDPEDEITRPIVLPSRFPSARHNPPKR